MCNRLGSRILPQDCSKDHLNVHKITSIFKEYTNGSRFQRLVPSTHGQSRTLRASWLAHAGSRCSFSVILNSYPKLGLIELRTGFRVLTFHFQVVAACAGCSCHHQRLPTALMDAHLVHSKEFTVHLREKHAVGGSRCRHCRPECLAGQHATRGSQSCRIDESMENAPRLPHMRVLGTACLSWPVIVTGMPWALRSRETSNPNLDSAGPASRFIMVQVVASLVPSATGS